MNVHQRLSRRSVRRNRWCYEKPWVGTPKILTHH